MSTSRSGLALRWSETPRVVKWALLAAAVLALYFAALPALDKLNDWNTRADNLARALSDKAKVRQETLSGAKLVEQATGMFGRPKPPERTSDTRGRLERRINQVFAVHKVQSQRTQYDEPAPLGEVDGAHSLMATGERLDKLVVKLTFETDMETLAAILKELESSPEIALVSRVNLKKQQPTGRRRDEPGALAVVLTAEAWGTSKPAAPPAGRNGAQGRNDSAGRFAATAGANTP